MEGTEYQNNWSTNDEAYTWSANKLGLTITGEYVMPIEHLEPQSPIENKTNETPINN
jgi:hypothetical protein